MSERTSVRQLVSLLRGRDGRARPRLLYTKEPLSAERALLIRATLIVGLLTAVLAVLWWDRAGLRDNTDGDVSFKDVVYFTMITVTTVGYGDIVPVTDRARMIDALFVTPVRIFIWLIFIGTAYRFLLQKVIEDYRMNRLERQLKQHIIIVGYGGSGSTAAQELVASGIDPGGIVVVENDEVRVRAAANKGYIGLIGEGTKEEMLRVAGADRARAAIVSLGRDDTNVLAVLTLRNLNPALRIIATVRDAENRKLVRVSGANVIVAPYQLGGFLLADAVANVNAPELLTDLLSCEGELAVKELEARPAEIGRSPRSIPDKLVLAIRRQGDVLRYWDESGLVIEAGDVLVAITRNPAK